MNEDFKSLVIRLQNNDSLAQKELYELFSVPMFNLCLRYIKNRQDAEEVLQNSFIKVYENIHKINNPEALPSWIKRIFIHTSIDAVRKQRIFYPIEFINNHASNSFADTKLNCFELVGLIERLPFRSRQVFMLYEIEGYSHKEISEILKITEGTSKSQLFFARNRLKLSYNEANNVNSLNLRYEFD